jgi:hypothetical protein
MVNTKKGIEENLNLMDHEGSFKKDQAKTQDSLLENRWVRLGGLLVSAASTLSTAVRQVKTGEALGAVHIAQYLGFGIIIGMYSTKYRNLLGITSKDGFQMYPAAILTLLQVLLACSVSAFQNLGLLQATMAFTASLFVTLCYQNSINEETRSALGCVQSAVYGLFGVQFVLNMLFQDSAMIGLFSSLGFEPQALSAILKIGSCLWILNGLIAHIRSKTSQRVLICLMIVSALFFGGFYFSARLNLTNLRQAVESNSNSDILISSLHSDYLDGQCGNKYTQGTQGPLFSTWEDKTPSTAPLNHQCLTAARSYYLSAISKIGMMLNMGWILTVLLLTGKLMNLNTQYRPTGLLARLSNALVYSVIGTLFFAIVYLLTERNATNSDYVSFANSQSSDNIQVQFGNLSLGALNSDYTLEGKFALERCPQDLQVTSNYGTDSAQKISVNKDCSFSVLQLKGNHQIAYSFRGIQNVLNLQNRLRTADTARASISGLPIVFNHDKFISTEVSVKDLLANSDINNFKIVVVRNSDSKVVYQETVASGAAKVELTGNYYTAYITANGYKSSLIESANLINENSIQVYLVKEQLCSNLIHTTTSLDSDHGIALEITNKASKRTCILTRENPVCPGALLVVRENKLSGNRDEFIGFNEKSGSSIKTMVYKYSWTSNSRSLQFKSLGLEDGMIIRFFGPSTTQVSTTSTTYPGLAKGDFDQTSGLPFSFEFQPLSGPATKIPDNIPPTTVANHIVTTDPYKYYHGKCEGTFEPGVRCKGVYTGWIVECTELVSKKETCKGREKKIRCEGLLNSVGCEGKYSEAIEINSSLFITSTRSETIYEAKTNSYRGVVILEHFGQEFEKTFLCERSYADNRKTCSSATMNLKASSEDKPYSKLVSCTGNLNAETGQCDEGLKARSCEGQVEKMKEFWTCKGKYNERECIGGGSDKACLTESAGNKLVQCTGYWNGATCQVENGRVEIISKNATQYFTGECSGTVTPNQKCDGVYTGELVTCPSAVTLTTLCGAKGVPVSCNGIITSDGCTGEYKTTVFIKDNGFKLSTKPGSRFTVTTNIVEGETTLQKGDSASNSEKQVCKDSYNDNTKECKPAKVTAFTTSGDKETEKSVTCDGSLNLKTDTCSTGFAYTNCEGDSTKSESNWTCKGSFKNFKCAKGGSPSGCNPTDPTDVSQTCVGYWDGSSCQVSAAKLEIITKNATQYFTGECSGTVTPNQKCDGVYTGELVTCPSAVTLTTLCGAKGIPVSCNGIITSDGCTGEYKTTVFIKDNGFKLSTKPGSRFTVTTNIVEGETTLQKGDSASNSEKQVCKDSYNDNTKECSPAKVTAFTTSGDKETEKSVICAGSLNLKTDTCSTGFAYTNCEGDSTKSESNWTCKGSFKNFKCAKGGSPSGCNPTDPTDVSQTCVGYWDGSSCQVSAAKLEIITKNATQYFTGECSGTVTPNQKCDGVYTGELVTCPSAVTLTTLCGAKGVPVSCNGIITSDGCTGEYKTTVFIKDNGFKLSTKPGSRFTVTTNIVEGETTLQKGDSASNSEKQVCKDSYNDNTKECKPAKVTAFTTSGDKETEKSVTCDGSLNLKTDTCSTGFAYTNCEGDSTKSESNWTCKGSFKNFKCAKGGSPSGCNPTDPTDVSQTCVGYWDGSSCQVSAAKLEIITKNATQYFTGECSGTVTPNQKCDGVYTGELVTCPSAVTLTTLCGAKGIPVSCNGIITSDGCTGEYKTTVFIKDNGFKLSTKPGSRFTVTTNIVEGETTLQKGDSASNSEKQVCKDSYNDNTKECSPAKVTAFTTSGDKETEKSVICAGSLNLKTDTCSTGFAYTNCEGDSTKSESNWTCKGSFKNFKCAKGGSPSGCNPTDPTDVSQTCVGYWDGSSCQVSAAKLEIITKNATQYFTGECSGTVTPNQKCDGVYTGELVTCPSAVTLTTLCGAKGIPVSCNGIITSDGCTGEYKTTVFIKDNGFKLSTKPGSKFTVTTNIVEGETTLQKGDSASNSEKQVCKDSYNDNTKECASQPKSLPSPPQETRRLRNLSSVQAH